MSEPRTYTEAEQEQFRYWLTPLGAAELWIKMDEQQTLLNTPILGDPEVANALMAETEALGVWRELDVEVKLRDLAESAPNPYQEGRVPAVAETVEQPVARVPTVAEMMRRPVEPLQPPQDRVAAEAVALARVGTRPVPQAVLSPVRAAEGTPRMTSRAAEAVPSRRR